MRLGWKVTNSQFWAKLHMNSRLRRFEILLPRQFNDGRIIPAKLRGLALQEIVDEFDAASFEPVSVEGYWRHEGILYHDSLSKIVIDIQNTHDNIQWMRDYKARWKEKLDQLDLWLISYEIDVF